MLATNDNPEFECAEVGLHLFRFVGSIGRTLKQLDLHRNATPMEAALFIRPGATV